MIGDVQVELKHVGVLAVNTDKDSARQAAKCGLIVGER